ncbi:metallophosphoesterase family protein [uncultured Devosia sp.]|uniref:metallophosphoesterase family protein n=1 Tax=uncultured Devosia sp. TaxID=211434 RepID=UPI0035C94D47
MRISLQRLSDYFGTRPEPVAGGRRLLRAKTWPAAVYAIGDIHGCLDELIGLERTILADASRIKGRKWLIYLGDYVDRGPNSAGVIDHLLSDPPASFTRICLAGNHETMMLNYLEAPDENARWLAFGGVETLQSYGISAGALQGASRRTMLATFDSHIPHEHVDFLRDCPLAMALPNATFVHAGLRPGIALEHQAEGDLLWIREDFLDADWPADQLVVHGHTPIAEPEMVGGRISVDTGAFATGQLSAVRLTEHGHPMVLSFSSSPVD